MNAKKKGNHGENVLANWLKRNGLNCFRNAASGGGVWKGDVGNDLDLTIEVKTVKRINLMECWRQVNRDASKARNAPLLAIHFDHMPKEEWLMVLHSEDWLHLVQENRRLTAETKDNSYKI